MSSDAANFARTTDGYADDDRELWYINYKLIIINIYDIKINQIINYHIIIG